MSSVHPDVGTRKAEAPNLKLAWRLASLDDAPVVWKVIEDAYVVEEGTAQTHRLRSTVQYCSRRLSLRLAAI